jgi:hypothetical protein
MVKAVREGRMAMSSTGSIPQPGAADPAKSGSILGTEELADVMQQMVGIVREVTRAQPTDPEAFKAKLDASQAKLATAAKQLQAAKREAEQRFNMALDLVKQQQTALAALAGSGGLSKADPSQLSKFSELMSRQQSTLMAFAQSGGVEAAVASRANTTNDMVQRAMANIKANIDDLTSTQMMEQMNLQSMTNKRQEAMDMLQNIADKQHDLAMSLIRNLRS